MATFAIGDVQGCYGALMSLLKTTGFDRARDRLWFTGDLVNRGTHSADVLRFVSQLGDRARCVLGNHDLHLLAVAAGARPLRRKDTFYDVLEAPDGDELLDWLRVRPLVHFDPQAGYLMVHAGLPPQWDVASALSRAAEVEATLRSPDDQQFFKHMYGDGPGAWSDELHGWERLRFITNCFTRIRYCDDQGRLTLAEKGPPGTQTPPFQPWFEIAHRKSRGQPIIFGHWATLQLNERIDPKHGVFHLDTGCAWGGSLTAMCLESRRCAEVSCDEAC